VAKPDTHISALSLARRFPASISNPCHHAQYHCWPPAALPATSAIAGIHQQPVPPRHKSGDPPPARTHDETCFGDPSGNPRPLNLWPTTILTALTTVGLLIPTCGLAEQPPQGQTLLPFTGSDSVSVVNQDSGRIDVHRGDILELRGHSVRLRHNGQGREQSWFLHEVVDLKFPQNDDHDRGLAALEAGNFSKARDYLRTALSHETRDWVRREIRASIARASLWLGDRPGAREQVQKIFDDDPTTRHLDLLPLQWDAEQVPEDRLTTVDQLTSPLLINQLLAASEWLTDPQALDDADAALVSLRFCGRRNVAELAETQLWRVRIIRPQNLRKAHINLWASRFSTLTSEAIDGARLVQGRALLLQHEYDDAALNLLRQPLTAIRNPYTAEASMRHAITALTAAGRSQAASQLQTEHQSRFHNLPLTTPQHQPNP
jgi:hypothetical protein